MVIWHALDPKYKMILLNYFFPLIYGSDSSRELKKGEVIVWRFYFWISRKW